MASCSIKGVMAKQVLNIALLVIFTVPVALAQDSSSGLKSKYSTQNIEFIDVKSPYYKTKGSYPALFSSLFDDYLSWIPTGEKKTTSKSVILKIGKQHSIIEKQSTEYNELGSYL